MSLVLIRLEQRQNKPFDIRTVPFLFIFSRKPRDLKVVHNYSTLLTVESRKSLNE